MEEEGYFIQKLGITFLIHILNSFLLDQIYQRILRRIQVNISFQIKFSINLLDRHLIHGAKKKITRFIEMDQIIVKIKSS
jgi:hypothetical protein